MALSAHQPCVDPEVRAAEKQASRDADARALAERRTTLAELQRENTPIRVSRERIDFSRSRSRLW